MNMMTVPQGDEAAIFFADRLNRLRSLEPQECDVLDAVMKRVRGPRRPCRRWRADDDARLLKMHRANISGRSMADTLNRSEHSVWARLRVLKKKERARG